MQSHHSIHDSVVEGVANEAKKESNPIEKESGQPGDPNENGVEEGKENRGWVTQSGLLFFFFFFFFLSVLHEQVTRQDKEGEGAGDITDGNKEDDTNNNNNNNNNNKENNTNNGNDENNKNANKIDSGGTQSKKDNSANEEKIVDAMARPAQAQAQVQAQNV
ncbi:hypothetical protein RFI_35502, partial [Reticulomyxa filosa]